MTTTTTEQTAIDVENQPAVPQTVVVDDTLTSKTVEVDTTITDDLTKSKPSVTSKLPTTDRIAKSSLNKILCGSTVSLVILGIISIIPLLQLLVGWRYADQCPINWRIPHYLVVAGIVGLVAVMLTIVQGLLALYIKKKTNDPDLQAAGVAAACGLCSISIVLFFLLVFLIGWFIAGCFWVFRPWNKVQYTYPNRADYCHPMLYRFAFWLLLLSVIYHIFSCGRSFIQTFKQVKNRQKGPLIAVPTTEP